MSRFPLVVFDLDGTLVDSRRDLAESVNDLIVERGGALLSEASVGRMVGDGAAVLVLRAFEAARLPADPDALGRFLAIYGARSLKHTRPYPGVIDLLARLEGKIELAVLTNKPLAATRDILAGLDLARYFPSDRVRGGDGPLPRKPDPAGLLRLASDAGVAPESVLLVGDSLIDWRTARAAGTAICLARWGFGFEGFPVAELAADNWVIGAPDELLEIVSRRPRSGRP